MNKENNRKTRKILNLMLGFGLLAQMLGCAAPSSQPVANTATPQAAATPANTNSASVAENPATAFYGKW